jgi:TonB family protein
VDGTVRLHATIDRNGAVRNLQPVSGPATLFEAAISAARYWRFRPIVSQGKAIEADRDIQVVFRNMLAGTQ